MEALVTNQDRATLPRTSRCTRSDLLHVRNLSVDIRQKSASDLHVLKDLNFAIAPGEIVGLLGESGCGKTTLALALMRLLPPAARVVEGSVEFQGKSLLTLEFRGLRAIRGSELSLIYQSSDVLNPVMRVGDQIMEVLRAHTDLTRTQLREQVFSILHILGFNDCDRIFRSYPHRLSGGQRGRIAIAQAVVCRPHLVVADEPTAWLDFKTSTEILSVFSRLRDLYQTAFLLISHTPDTLRLADRALVMYAGQIVESGPTSELFERPQHPYTRALLQCRIDAGASQRLVSRRRRFVCIPGHAPDPSEVLSGCSFACRCENRMELCGLREPELIEIQANHSVRCFKFGDSA
jgi:peptide/nickel transport system ATP-binding protein